MNTHLLYKEARFEAATWILLYRSVSLFLLVSRKADSDDNSSYRLVEGSQGGEYAGNIALTTPFVEMKLMNLILTHDEFVQEKQ